ncbi:hypothetical protein [Azospirillum sp. BE72]|uniref:hypothetical protein n=1 Tax=Azospirillum sp. BE72 TaxID=2817776 RepID=UPI00285F8D29|nr:hypothetical protein [Azospirillum sp. BE72]MDR6775684.1 hypothetical protein [Azospirillum sp. BE72]
MLDAELELYGDLFVACRFHEAGLTFEQFLRHPMKAIASLENGPAVQRWGRMRAVSATKLAKSACSSPPPALTNEARRQAGIAEHERFDAEVRRFFAAG